MEVRISLFLVCEQILHTVQTFYISNKVIYALYIISFLIVNYIYIYLRILITMYGNFHKQLLFHIHLYINMKIIKFTV